MSLCCRLRASIFLLGDNCIHTEAAGACHWYLVPSCDLNECTSIGLGDDGFCLSGVLAPVAMPADCYGQLGVDYALPALLAGMSARMHAVLNCVCSVTSRHPGYRHSFCEFDVHYAGTVHIQYT